MYPERTSAPSALQHATLILRSLRRHLPRTLQGTSAPSALQHATLWLRYLRRHLPIFFTRLCCSATVYQCTAVRHLVLQHLALLPTALVLHGSIVVTSDYCADSGIRGFAGHCYTMTSAGPALHGPACAKGLSLGTARARDSLLQRVTQAKVRLQVCTAHTTMTLGPKFALDSTFYDIH
jgi:hypothetical protein